MTMTETAEEMPDRKPQRTVHTFLAEMKVWQDQRQELRQNDGGFVYIADNVKCVNRDCKAPIRRGERCYKYPDGSCECLTCHPERKPRPVVKDVAQLECVICGSEFQAPEPGEETDEDDEHQLCCSRKCRRTLDRRNKQPAERAEAEKG
jgi:hypothetical protein